jgi:hypothetical protein
METVTWLRSTDVPNDALGPLLSDYLALDRLRSFRRLLLVRCGSLALATAVLGPLVGWLSAVARSVMVAVFLVPPCMGVDSREACRHSVVGALAVDQDRFSRACSSAPGPE